MCRPAPARPRAWRPRPRAAALRRTGELTPHLRGVYVVERERPGWWARFVTERMPMPRTLSLNLLLSLRLLSLIGLSGEGRVRAG